MRNLSIISAAIVFASFVACGSEGSDGTTSDTGGGGTSSVSGGAGPTSASGASGGASVGGSGGEMENCPQISVAKLRAYALTFRAKVNEPLDGAPDDILSIELNPNGPLTGMIDLGSAVNKDIETCEACVIVSVDNDASFYFQDRGTLDFGSYVFTANDLEAQYVMGGSLKNVRLREYDDALAPVPNGKCLTLADTPINLMEPPAAWTCELAAYDDGELCDCECGASDPDCAIPNAPVEGCLANEMCVNDTCQ